jgi:nucleoside-diphosphate-sugar epimerase
VITGAAGLLGTLLSQRLGDRYEVEGVDRARTRAAHVHRADTARSRSLDSLFRGADAVIDLAGLAGADTPWPKVWENNLPATMNALEAARRAGVKRFVYASSNHVTGMYEREPPYAAIVAGEYDGLEPNGVPLIRADWPLRPDGPYAIGKALGEAAARYYADAFGLAAICLRIGTVNAEDRPTEARHFATLLSHADLVRLVEAAVRAPDDLRFGVYYGVSGNTWRIWAVDDARSELGYEPQDDAERFRELPPR